MEEEVVPLLWALTGFDEERDTNVLQRCRLLERAFRELALDGGHLSAPARAGSAQAVESGLSSLAYGEILLESFAELLLHKAWPHWKRWQCRPDDDGDEPDGAGAGDVAIRRWHTFVDLGSGMGKAVWVARLIDGGFAGRVMGIELVAALHEGAVAAWRRLEAMPEQLTRCATFTE